MMLRRAGTFAVIFAIVGVSLAPTTTMAAGGNPVEEFEARIDAKVAQMKVAQAELEAKVAELAELTNSQKKVSHRTLPAKNSKPQKNAARKLQDAAPAPAPPSLADLAGTLGGLAVCLDYMWLLVSGALVMFMQAGFAMLECGSVREKNAGTVLLKNAMDACAGTLCWYFIGYGIAYGLPESPNTFAGSENFAGAAFLEEDAEGGIIGTGHFKDWFFQWAFCATAATIVSGGVAERMQFISYVVYSVVMTAIIYPFIVYWTWSGSGFLTEMGYSDFAGSGIVHLTGGVGAFVGAAILGPRSGRFDPNAPEDAYDPHNMGLVVLGTFILWFGWYGFNCGSTLAFSDVGTATTGAMVAMNTTISAATGGLTVFLLRKRSGRNDLAGMCNGILSGLVAVCAGVGDVEPGMALLIGLLGGVFYELGHVMMLKLKIDDPLDAFAVHGMAGICGVILRPILSKGGFQGEMFGAHMCGLGVIIGWTGILSALVFGGLKVAGKLRISDDMEQMGTDQGELAQKNFSRGEHSPISPVAKPQN